MIYLYVKTHNITGLKYFGKTISKDPHKYKGSGTVWRRHIKKHGYNVTTEIVGSYDDNDECLKQALQFSIDNDIVSSSKWANLKLESLDGGWDHINSLSSEERYAKCNAWIKTKSPEELEEINAKKARHKEDNYWWGKNRSGELNPMFGKEHSLETRAKISKANTGKQNSPETRAKISKSNTGKKITFTEEWKANIRKAAQNLEKVKCPHCDIIGGQSIMKRWHFDRCKNKI